MPKSKAQQKQQEKFKKKIALAKKIYAKGGCTWKEAIQKAWKKS
jgi:hypothetical protein